MYNGCVIQQGSLICWKNNYNKIIKVLEANVTAISLSKWSVCAIQRGALKCWGNNFYGQLGNGTTKTSLIPQIVKGMGSGVTSVSLSRSYACAIQQGALKCWGNNFYGQLGNGTTKTSLIPQIAKGMESGVTAVSLMDTEIETKKQYKESYACAIQRGALKCWGNNNRGQLGNGTTKTSLIPQIAKGIESGVTAVSLERNYACAIQRGALKCWGNNNRGQLGNGTTKTSLIPQIAKGMESGVTAVSVSDRSIFSSHTCAIQKRAVKCSGDNLYNQLGNKNFKDSYNVTFANVNNLESDVSILSSANRYNCAIQNEALKCWGNNMEGQLGNGKKYIEKANVKIIFLRALRRIKYIIYASGLI